MQKNTCCCCIHVYKPTIIKCSIFCKYNVSTYYMPCLMRSFLFYESVASAFYVEYWKQLHVQLWLIEDICSLITLLLISSMSFIMVCQRFVKTRYWPVNVVMIMKFFHFLGVILYFKTFQVRHSRTVLFQGMSLFLKSWYRWLFVDIFLYWITWSWINSNLVCLCFSKMR